MKIHKSILGIFDEEVTDRYCTVYTRKEDKLHIMKSIESIKTPFLGSNLTVMRKKFRVTSLPGITIFLLIGGRRYLSPRSSRFSSILLLATKTSCR